MKVEHGHTPEKISGWPQIFGEIGMEGVNVDALVAKLEEQPADSDFMTTLSELALKWTEATDPQSKKVASARIVGELKGAGLI